MVAAVEFWPANVQTESTRRCKLFPRMVTIVPPHVADVVGQILRTCANASSGRTSKDTEDTDWTPSMNTQMSTMPDEGSGGTKHNMVDAD
eukprot:28853-Rhodomonas_salina.1